MASALWQCSMRGSTFGASTTNYGVAGTGVFGTASTNDVEGRRTVICHSTGTFSHLALSVLSNDRGASTFTFRKNNAAGNQSISIGSSASGEFSDASNTDVVAASDVVALQLVTGAGGTAFNGTAAQVRFDASSDTVTRTAGVFGSTLANGSFYPLIGRVVAQTTENRAQYKAQAAGTAKNAYAFFSANSRSSTSTLTLRQGAANTALVLSIPSGTTGVIEDTSDTVTLSAGDLLDWGATLAAGSGSITLEMIACELVTTTSAWFAAGYLGTTLLAAATDYVSIAGPESISTTETDVSNVLNLGATFSKLGCFLQTNTVTAASTLKFRKNAGNGNLSCSITASTTGHFEDATHSDAAAATDVVALQFVIGATGTSMVVRTIDLLATTSVAAASGGPFPHFLRRTLTGGFLSIRGGLN